MKLHRVTNAALSPGAWATAQEQAPRGPHSAPGPPGPAGLTPFPAAIKLLGQIEGLGDPANNSFSAACGPDFHQEVRLLERRIGAQLFPIGAEDGWLAFLMDQHGRCYACDLPYGIPAFGSWMTCC